MYTSETENVSETDLIFSLLFLNYYIFVIMFLILTFIVALGERYGFDTIRILLLLFRFLCL